MAVWTLDDALVLIRDLQPLVRPLGYHITLGGGVLNTGSSDKDLDLFFLRLSGDESDALLDPLMELLRGAFGPLFPIRDTLDYLGEVQHYREVQKGHYLGRRVDLFVQ